VITDPPYGETSLAWDKWPQGWPDVAALVTDALWCFGSVRMFFENLHDFAAWKYSQEVVWEKHNGSSLANDRFRRVHEIAALWYRGNWADLRHVVPTTDDATARTVRRKAKPAHHQGERGASIFTSVDGGPRLMRSVLKVRSEHGRAIHPTQKPVGIVNPLIEYSVPEGGRLIDLYSGSASIAVAARQLGRRCIAFEADERYAMRSAERLASELALGI
jgi:site-specific DNA-methyltransferase (adenine-specific)